MHNLIFNYFFNFNKSKQTELSARRFLEKHQNFFPQINADKKTIEGVNIFSLRKQFGTPLFIVSKKALRAKIFAIKKNLNRLYPNSMIAFSMKTNNLASLNKFYEENGFLAETVSDYEYWLAQRLGFKQNKIILNGPSKSYNLLRQAITNSTIIHVDNFSELNTINKLTDKLKKRTAVGIRVIPYVSGYQSRFGFSIKNGDAWRACQKISACKFVDLTGLHYHLGPNIFSLNHYRQASESVCNFITELAAPIKLKLKYLDVGGGFPSWGGGGSEISAYLSYSGRYLEAIAKPIINSKLNYLKLIIEPGRSLVDESILLLSSVTNSSFDGNKQNASIDASLNILPLAQTRKQQIEVIYSDKINSRLRNVFQQTIFWGSSCVESDWLAKQPAPLLQPEDIVIFYNAGAYNISQANQFIRLRPAVIGLDDGKARILRRKENFADLYRLEKEKL